MPSRIAVGGRGNAPIASQGLLLKDQRTKADYQPSSRIGRYAATQAVRSAKGIIGALDRLVP
jgi:hypothetical protein